MIKLALATPAFLAGAISSCASALGDDAIEMRVGETASQAVQVEAFSSLGVAGPYEVMVEPGDDVSITIEGPENVIEHTDFSVEDGRLKIRTRKVDGDLIMWTGNATTRISIVSPTLEGASVAGSGLIDLAQAGGSRFKGSVAGSGDLRVRQLDAPNAEFSIAGSGDVDAAGNARDLAVKIAGSGTFDGPELEAETASISIAGSGDVAAHVTETANISIAGSGDVELTGGAECTVRKAGSGDVRCS